MHTDNEIVNRFATVARTNPRDESPLEDLDVIEVAGVYERLPSGDKNADIGREMVAFIDGRQREAEVEKEKKDRSYQRAPLYIALASLLLASLALLRSCSECQCPPLP